MPILLVHDRESCEHHIKGTVDDGHVDGKQEHDGFSKQKYSQTRQSFLERLADRLHAATAFDGGFIDLASLLADSCCAAFEEYRCVGFGDNERANDLKGPSENHHEAFNPAPALCFTQKPTYNRSQGGTHERCSGENGHGQPTLRCGEHVRNDTAGIRQGGGTKSAGEESKDDKCLYIVSASGSRIESREDAVGGEEEDLPAIKLG